MRPGHEEDVLKKITIPVCYRPRRRIKFDKIIRSAAVPLKEIHACDVADSFVLKWEARV
jgi:hypothetical protein